MSDDETRGQKVEEKPKVKRGDMDGARPPEPPSSPPPRQPSEPYC